jgi:hypothetical protein
MIKSKKLVSVILLFAVSMKLGTLPIFLIVHR